MAFLERMTDMKKVLTLILALCMLLSGGALAIEAENVGSYSWYCVRKSENLQPSCDPSMRFIENYGGYYIDHRYGDSERDKVVYLTFDAGYENGNITKVLDILKSEQVKGAFFVLAHLIEVETELVKRMANEGHLVCNHTAMHKDMTKIHDQAEFAAELDALETLYAERTGNKLARYYRPPCGRFSEENLKFAESLGYNTIFWSFAYADWDNDHQMSPAAAQKKILDNVHNGAVILLHPTSETNALILRNVIKALRAQGYRFGTLDELTKKA